MEVGNVRDAVGFVGSSVVDEHFVAGIECAAHDGWAEESGSADYEQVHVHASFYDGLGQRQYVMTTGLWIWAQG